MQIRIVQVFIVGYLALLGFGLYSQIVGSKWASHAALHFLVWDMYGGSSPLEERRHLIAEGESGAYYELTAPPWGEFVPFGSAGRVNYDFTTFFAPRMAVHTLQHTQHEPITRILLVDELWNRKYNMNNGAWRVRHEEPRTRRSYYYLRAGYDSDGTPISRYYDFCGNLAHQTLLNNPRLQQAISRNRTYSSLNGLREPTTHDVRPAAYFLPIQ